jgi:hypothetical protein
MPVIPAEEAEAGFKHGLHIKPCVKKPKQQKKKKRGVLVTKYLFPKCWMFSWD